MENNNFEYWDNIADDWQHSQERRLWRRHSDAIHTRLFLRWLPEQKVDALLKTDLFDESLTDGVYPLMKSRAKRVVGMDISPAILAAVRQRHQDIELIEADVRDLPFPDKTFDAIISNSTLDHFHTADEILLSLAELKRVLKTNGLLFVSLDNMANPAIAVRNFLPFKLLNKLGLVPYYVGVSFGPSRLKRALRDLGFEIQEIDALWHFPRVFAVSIANFLEKYASKNWQKRYLDFLMLFEKLANLPTRFLSGYFVIVKARKID